MQGRDETGEERGMPRVCLVVVAGFAIASNSDDLDGGHFEQSLRSACDAEAAGASTTEREPWVRGVTRLCLISAEDTCGETERGGGLECDCLVQTGGFKDGEYRGEKVGLRQRHLRTTAENKQGSHCTIVNLANDLAAEAGCVVEQS